MKKTMGESSTIDFPCPDHFTSLGPRCVGSAGTDKISVVGKISPR